MFLPLFLLLIFDLFSLFLIIIILIPAALKNNNRERGLLLEALIIYSLLIGIISY
jgi:hypothetical protein